MTHFVVGKDRERRLIAALISVIQLMDAGLKSTLNFFSIIEKM
jgi:hypothetical protein